MDTTKIITLTSFGITAFAISLTVIQLIIRKEKTKSENEGKIRLAYGILFATWVVAFTFLNFKSLSILNEFIDTISKLNVNNPLTDIVKTSVIFIGLMNVWLILWHFITNVFSILFLGKRKDIHEVENNNYVYFLVKGIVFISFIYSTMTIYENLLRFFLPNIEIPFYH